MQRKFLFALGTTALLIALAACMALFTTLTTAITQRGTVRQSLTVAAIFFPSYLALLVSIR